VNTQATSDWVREFQEWLSKSTPNDLTPLVRWLQGLGLPAIDPDYHPYQLIYDSILPDDPEVEFALAQAIAELLNLARANTKLEQSGIVEDLRLDFNRNLFALCGRLDDPDLLADPLSQWVSSSRLLTPIEQSDLLNAIIHNQNDSRYRQVWYSLLRGEGTILPGTHFDGFQGMCRMPSSAEARGEPSLEDVGNSLKLMATYMESRALHDRRNEFKSLVKDILSLYPHRDDLPYRLIVHADAHHLPVWAVDSFPFLCAPLPADGAEVSADLVLWKFVRDCIMPSDPGVSDVRSYCSNHFVAVSLNADGFDSVHRLLPIFDREHSEQCDPSEKAISAEILTSMGRAHQSVDDATKEHIRRVHKRVRELCWEPK
jgi:hypothetical protein